MRIYLFTAKILYVSKLLKKMLKKITYALYKFNNILYTYCIVWAHFVAF